MPNDAKPKRKRVRVQEPTELTVEQRKWPAADIAREGRVTILELRETDHPPTDHLRAALAGMPDPDRQAFALCVFEGLTDRAIADRLGTNPAAAGAAVSRAALLLRNALAGG